MKPLSSKRLALIQARLQAAGLGQKTEDCIEPRAATEPAPLSFAQERLWFFSRMTADSPVFNIPAAYRITGALEVERLRSAFGSVLDRHETLRTRFGVEGGRAVQHIDACIEAPPLELVDVSGAAPATVEKLERALELAREECRRPFDLEVAPLVRLTLYRLGADDHLLLLSVHHIVSEVQSLGVLMRDLARAYAATNDSEPSLSIQFADFAAWQRARMKGERWSAQLDWWRSRLSGELPALQLPTDRPAPAVQTFVGSTRTRSLPASLARKLRAYCVQEKCTPFTATLAIWGALLARVSRREDILIGVPVTDRNRTEVRDLIGFFVNTLVMRADLTGGPSFRALLARVKDHYLGAQSNQDLPFDHLVEELGVERDLSHSPIFQVAFLYQTREESGGDLPALGPGTTIAPLEDPLAVHTATSKFSASLVIWDRGSQDFHNSSGSGEGALSASMEYNTDLFDAATIDRILEQYEVLLTGALSRPDEPLASLSILTETEAHKILVQWNATEQPLPNKPVHRMFEECAERSPAALAGTFEEEEISYGELEDRANRLAQHLISIGVGHEDVVAIATGRRLEMLVAILATHKAGAAYLPLDLEYPKDRLGYLIDHACVRVVLTMAGERASLPALDADGLCVLELDTEKDLIARQSADRPLCVATPDSLAYVIYTSGSTGTPKGVALEHRALCNLLTWHRRAYDVQPTDRATHLAGLAFDASVWELWPYLTAGASLHLVSDDVRLAPRRLIDWMVEKRITQSFIPTPLCEAMLREELPAEMPLEVVFTGGDKLRRAPDRALPFRLVNHYGPTESAVVATSTPVRTQPDDETPPPIGKPIDNVRVYLLDPGGMPVPVGVVGELFIGGSSLAREYFKSPELTAERFGPSPIDPDERLYATGDLVRWRPDGQIEFLGRLDDQVKVRGFRIELGEIEAQLSTHVAIEDCAALVKRNEAGDGVLIGYVVLRASGSSTTAPSSEDLREFLRMRFPEYMVPATILFLPEFPLTPNGKLDRRALPEPNFEEALQESYVTPEGELEERIAKIWCDVLELERVGANTNFFDMGGHSLLLAQVHAELQTVLDSKLGIVELFRFPTVRSLAQHLAGAGAAGEDEKELVKSKDRGARRREALRGRGRRRG